jgi:hypothetical protein
MTFELNTLRRGAAACAVACATLLAGPAHAAAVLSQDWVSTWALPNLNGPGVQTGQDSGGGKGGGSITVDANMPAGVVTGDSTMSFDEAQGRLRSGSNLDVTLLGSEGWGDFFVVVLNSLDLNDQLTVDHNGFGFMKIMIRTTGNMVQNGQIDGPPFGFAGVKLQNGVRASASVAGGDSMSFKDNLDNDFLGLFDGTFQVNETQSVHSFMELIVPWEDDVPVDFSFQYADYFQYEVKSVDAERVTLHGENNFGHTLELFANVYDDRGQWLQGVRVGSSSGIGYLNLDPDGSVPEPSSLALVAFGVLAFAARRRRAA